LPDSYIERIIRVVVEGIGITSTGMRDDTFTAYLVPTIVFGAPGGNVNEVFSSATGAVWTLARGTIASTVICHR